MRVRHKFHPQIGPSAPSLPCRVVEKPVELSDGRIVVHKVKVYRPLPATDVDQQVSPSCLNEKIRWDPRKRTTRTG